MNYEVEVSYNERNYDLVHVEADEPQQAEYLAMNMLQDGNPDISNVDVLGVRAVG